jgi:hypothetical protein
VFDFLKLARNMMAATVLAVAFAATPAAAQQSPALTVTDKSPTGELTFWNGIKDSTDVLSFKTYLENFPNGMFYDLALAKFNSLGGSVTDLKPVTKERVTPENSGNAKPKLVVAKKKSSLITRKKAVSHKTKKKPLLHVVKKVANKNTVTHPKLIKRRKRVVDPGGGGGGGGGGWNG